MLMWNESVTLRGGFFALQVTQGQTQHTQCCFCFPTLPPNTSAPEKEPRRWHSLFVIPLGAALSRELSNLVFLLIPQWWSSHISAYIFQSHIGATIPSSLALKMGDKALFHNINAMKKSPQEASELNSLSTVQRKKGYLTAMQLVFAHVGRKRERNAHPDTSDIYFWLTIFQVITAHASNTSTYWYEQQLPPPEPGSQQKKSTWSNMSGQHFIFQFQRLT